MADVRAMKAVFTNLNCLSEIQTHSPSQQLEIWRSQKLKYQRTTALIASLGKPSITAPQAKRLDTLSLSFPSLCSIHSEARNDIEFVDILKKKGVNSKPLREKLAKLLGNRKEQ